MEFALGSSAIPMAHISLHTDTWRLNLRMAAHTFCNVYVNTYQMAQGSVQSLQIILQAPPTSR